jgi:hypothetical protein
MIIDNVIINMNNKEESKLSSLLLQNKINKKYDNYYQKSEEHESEDSFYIFLYFIYLFIFIFIFYFIYFKLN